MKFIIIIIILLIIAFAVSQNGCGETKNTPTRVYLPDDWHYYPEFMFFSSGDFEIYTYDVDSKECPPIIASRIRDVDIYAYDDGTYGIFGNCTDCPSNDRYNEGFIDGWNAANTNDPTAFDNWFNNYYNTTYKDSYCKEWCDIAPSKRNKDNPFDCNCEPDELTTSGSANAQTNFSGCCSPCNPDDDNNCNRNCITLELCPEMEQSHGGYFNHNKR